jgi:iron complex transport system substrate-binding protein
LKLASVTSIDLEVVSTYTSFDAEKIVELAPEVVIMDKTLDVTEANFNTMKQLNIPVFRVYPTDLDQVISMISEIGEILGFEDEAENIVNDMNQRKDNIAEEVEGIDDDDKPSVLYIIYYDGLTDPYVGTSSTFSGDLIELAGGKNTIVDDNGISVQVSLETIIDSDPDMIITSMSFGFSAKNTILSMDTWEDITAVKNSEVHDIDGNLIDRTGPSLIDGLEEIHAALYP